MYLPLPPFLTPYYKFVAVPWEPCGIPSYGLYSYNWALHSLCHPHLLTRDAGTQILCTGALQPWPMRSFSGLDSCSLGLNHHCPLLAACSLSCHQGYSQLHSGGRWRPLLLNCLVVGFQRSALVQGPDNQYRFIDKDNE